jgi:hypothetical protein
MDDELRLHATSAEQVLVAEREAIAAWLVDLEQRVRHDVRIYERVLRLRKIVGKLDNRIRLLREVRPSR